MVRPDRAQMAQTAPLEDLLAILLRQFRRPLETLDVALSSSDAQALAHAVVSREPAGAKAVEVRSALVTLVHESEAVLAGWALTFQTSLETGMEAMPGWETTAEFLDIANTKSNAEIRIATGATLVAALGDFRFGDVLLYLALHDATDVDSVVARRVLLFQSGVDPAAPDWAAQVRAWLNAQAARGEG